MPARRSPHYVVVSAGYVLGAAALFAGLPDQIPPSLTLSAGNVIWLGAPMVAFLLPTASAVTYALLRGLCTRQVIVSPDATHSIAVLEAILLRWTTFVIGVHATMLAGLLGMFSGRGWAAEIVPIMLGLTMIGIGNLLPRTRRNLAIGIRTSRTLSNDAVWMKTHRLAGYLVVAGGCIVILAAIVVPAPIGPGMILLVGPAATVGMFVLAMHSARRAGA